ncbi:MAG: cupin domain-containing protein [Novosphingobium sp.]
MYRNYRGNSSCGKPNPSACRGTDLGPQPVVIHISQATEKNCNYRTALWTGCYLQVTLMCIPAGGEIGLELHPDTDQFIRLEEGQGIVKMGPAQNQMCFQKCVMKDDAIIIPAGTWHNLINTGRCPIKLYSIYAPPHHPRGTVERTKADADSAAAPMPWPRC